MKTLLAALALTLTLSSVAFAEGEGSGNDNMPTAPRDQQTIVGGGCVAHIVGSNGDNGGPEIVYTGTCYSLPANPRALEELNDNQNNGGA